MKVLILADLEGVSGVGDYRVLIPAGPIYQKACANLTKDINAAVRGLRKEGATEIDLVDSHSTVWPDRIGPRNIIKDELDSGIQRIMGGWDLLELTRSEEDTLRSYDAQVIVGEHAMAGTPDGFVSHTHSDNTALRINGQYIGEIEWHTWLMGYYGVPTIMVTGDAAAVREATTFFPEIEGVTVKTAKSRDKAKCVSTTKSWSLIEKASSRALRNLDKHRPHLPHSPVRLDLVFSTPGPARFGSYMPKARQIDERTISYIATNFREAIWAHMSLVMLGALHTFSDDFKKLWQLLPERSQKEFNDEYEKKIAKWVKEPSPFLISNPRKKHVR